MKKLLSLLIVLIFSNSFVLGSEIWLKSGEILEGDIIEEKGESITIRGEGWWKEIPRSDIERIIRAEKKEPKEAIQPDPKITDVEVAKLEKEKSKLESKRNTDGTILTILGLGATGVGVLVKFGDEELRVTDTKISYEKTYNALNYILIGGGAIMTIVGIAKLSTPSQKEREIENKISRLSLNLNEEYCGLVFSKRF